MDELPALVHERHMALAREAEATRILTALGLVLWLLCALVSVWEALALQSPVSPLHLGVLPGPINQLRNACFAYGTGALVLGQCWTRLFAAGTGRIALLCLLAGTAAQLTALSYAACCGLWAVQLQDPRADARVLVGVRLLAHGITMLGLASVCVRALRRRPPAG